MKRIALSLMTIATVAVLSVGATSAYFTDQEEIKGLTFSTGTVEITVSQPSYQRMVFDNLKPGDSIRKYVTVHNNGSLDIASLKVSAVNKSDDAGLLNHLTVALYGTVDGYEQGIYTPDWGTGQPVNAFLNGVDVLSTAVYREATAGHLLLPGADDALVIDFKVPTTLGNTWQGKSVTFDLRFEAEQSRTGSRYF